MRISLPPRNLSQGTPVAIQAEACIGGSGKVLSIESCEKHYRSQGLMYKCRFWWKFSE